MAQRIRITHGLLRIAMAQINTCVGDFEANTQKIARAIHQARAKGCDSIVFPELAVCGYPPEDMLFKQSFVRENIRQLKRIQKETKDILAVVGFVDKKGNRLFNSAAVIANQKIVGIYHKVHLPNYGVFDEKRYFSSGEHYEVYAFRGNYFAVNICEDIWINDGVIAAQAKAGAGIIFTINASPYHRGKISLRQKVLKEQAKKNQVFIVYVNLVGGQDELVFDGQSMLISDKGKVLSLAPAFQEDLHIVDIALSKLPSKQTPRKGYVKTITIPESLKPVLEPVAQAKLKPLEDVFQALVAGTRDYVLKNGFKRVVLGLSGGIDSSLVAAIAVKALGKENVSGVLLPSHFNSQASYDDAISVAQNLGIEYNVIPIQEIFENYLKVLRPYFEGKPWNVAEENLQARIRGTILMAFSNKFGWMVLTTGNKSEMGVGYATLYGDMAGGFAVIKDVPKTLVYKLCEFYNVISGKEVIPGRVFSKAPTAELRENQKDSDSLPVYEALDPILKYYIEDDLPISKIVEKGFSKNEVVRTAQMVDRSEYKRRQSPPGVKITPRAFGRDSRMPITNKFREVM
ncbi:MAG TPA: NAD+ synthase [Candidatus Omnitrophica bacterium]|nr:NAD+ synthase [Candidatus Omnitrophota bacterium]